MLSKNTANTVLYLRSFLKHHLLGIETVRGTHTPELFDIPGKGKCWGILLNSKTKTKKCTKCAKEKTLDNFRIDKSGASGRRSICKECEKNK